MKSWHRTKRVLRQNNVVLYKYAKKVIDRACEQGFTVKSKTETVVFSATYNEEINFGEFDTDPCRSQVNLNK